MAMRGKCPGDPGFPCLQCNVSLIDSIAIGMFVYMSMMRLWWADDIQTHEPSRIKALLENSKLFHPFLASNNIQRMETDAKTIFSQKKLTLSFLSVAPRA